MWRPLSSNIRVRLPKLYAGDNKISRTADTTSERERGYEMNKEMKEIDEVLTNLWWSAEISDTTKLWWNDHYREIRERELAN